MSAKRVVSVGQCGADHSAISATLRKHFGAEVIGVDAWEAALALLKQQPAALVLVNRILDEDGSPGLEVIRKLRADEAVGNVPIMLVSNYEDAQVEAQSLGAVKGFGKAALGQPQMLARVGNYLG
jgi:two-component system chemotaxis response regulator CheY